MINFILGLSVMEQLVYGVLILSFLYQCCVWFGYGAIATHRHHTKPKKGDKLPPISIIVVVGNAQKWFVEDELGGLLKQKYSGEWEVVVVNDCGGVELTEALTELAQRSQNLRFTELKKDLKFAHTKKMPIMVGIKAAKYPNILFSDPTVQVRGDAWLNLMAKGFIGGELVVGYAGFTQNTNNIIRASRLMGSIRAISAAIADKPYKGIYSNMGYTQKIFFETKGFTHLRLDAGEDDLFVQKIAKQKVDCSVIINPKCTVEQFPQGGLRWWWCEQRYRTFAYKYYPMSVKFWNFMELLTKILLFVSVGWVITTSLEHTMRLKECLIDNTQWWKPLLLHPGWMVAVGLMLLRELIVLRTVKRVCIRLGEKKLVWSFMIYDLINVFTETILALSRRMLKVSAIWK